MSGCNPTACRGFRLSLKRFDTVRPRLTLALLLTCPDRNPSELQRVSSIHTDDLHESRDRNSSVFAGSSDGLLFGRCRVKNQRRLSTRVSVPRDLPCLNCPKNAKPLEHCHLARIVPFVRFFKSERGATTQRRMTATKTRSRNRSNISKS